ncbi:DUF4124 domain-containing protein [Marinobacter halophilus]|uniref:DUF4124 domain-containing protein n=1 Tax=Marinobacter halophilus TaxID=1323740 RepID=A0A2T1KFJ6_9GAMM|nr:DUF4124 domain-containing protein [Marinobacter halophilus]PSF08543.1 DUF4124 domain-containing protein [Marinobacter halophilus]GGC61554.1 hypothetical protein GCM10011362_07530 [Marinobacter halophilus]
MPRTMALSLLFVFSCSSAQAEIYRWIDANGSIHFSDKPPALQPHSQVQLRSTATVPMNENIHQAERISRQRKELDELLAPSSKARYAKARRKQGDRDKQCEKYRQQLDRLQTRLRAGYGNDRGNSLRQQRRELSHSFSLECMLN